MKTGWRKSLETVICVLLGNVILSVAVAAFVVPHGIIMGGATGVRSEEHTSELQSH